MDDQVASYLASRLCTSILFVRGSLGANWKAYLLLEHNLHAWLHPGSLHAFGYWLVRLGF